MQILTETEYDDLVDELAGRVFDPMHPDDAVSDVSLRWIEMVEDGKQDAVREKIREELDYVVVFDHGIHDSGPLGEMEPATAGCIMQHSQRANRVKPDDVDGSGAETVTRKMAARVLWEDVQGEVHERVRNSLKD